MSAHLPDFESIEKRLIDDAPHAVLFAGPDWNVVYTNRRALALTQNPTAGVIGSSLWFAFPQLANPDSELHFRRAMEGRVEIEFEIETERERWWQVCLRPHETGIALYGRDIAEFKRTEQTLQEREAELSDFFQKGSVALHWVGPDGTILWANEMELAMLGYAPEEYIGRNIREFHVDQPLIEDMLSRLANHEGLQNFESCLRCKDGTVRHVAISSSGYWKNGSFVHTRCFTRDITAEKARTEMQERLGAIVESTDDAIISKDLNGIITSWNTSAERLFGYTAQEAIGQSAARLLIPGDRQEEEPEILDSLRRGERVDHFETKRKRKDGSLIGVSLTISPIREAGGRIIGVSKIARDVSERQRIEKAALLLSAIVDSSDDAIISKDLNGVITSWNRSAERLFGYSAEEAIGQPVARILIPADRQDEEVEILSKLRRGERVDHFETKRRRKDGTLLDISLTISPVKNMQDRIIGASKIARNITEQVRDREALRSANEALRRSNADLEQFAYSASHDLQEPLRMISTYGEMLRRKYSGQLDEKAREYLGFVVEGGARMERLLHDLRTFTQSSISSPGPPPTVDAQDVLKRALENLQPAIEEAGAQVTSEHLPFVTLHDFQLEQLFQNIIGNAIRYRRETPRIHVKADRNAVGWTFSIQDNGIGIEPEYKEQIFGLFKRLHSVSEYPGSGLGLAICQRIVERAGGRIWVESEPRRGSTFFFTLPGPASETGAGDAAPADCAGGG